MVLDLFFIIYMDELDFNGYEYVDLGLPSGTVWAKCNIGAEKESDYGLYFAWGETVGYSESDVNNGTHGFSPEDYKFNGGGGEWSCDGSPMTKYNPSDNLTILEPSDDAATVNMGGNWRMPSIEEYRELTSNTASTWTTVNGVNGRLFTSRINGNTLFLPASGYCKDGSFFRGGNIGYYWSSSLYYYSPTNANVFCYNDGRNYEDYYHRYFGYSVRGVISNDSGTTTTTTSTTPGPDIITTTTTTTSTTSTTTTSTTPGPDITTTTTTTTSTTSTSTPKPPYSPSTGKKPSHLFVFPSESDYNQVKENLTKPNVSYIKDIKKVSYKSKPKENYNGYEYVDLGLPSGLKWAKCNVGAEKESDYGLYFAWGETIGYKDVSSGKSFSPDDYKFENGDACDGKFTKYDSSDNLTTLLSEDDAASVNMGGSWHMPSKEQFEELINTSYTTTTWTTVNGVYGRKITSKTNGNTLFLPASGLCIPGFVSSIGSYGFYWSSSLDEDYPSRAWYLNFYSGSIGVNSDSRYYGRTVRGVVG